MKKKSSITPTMRYINCTEAIEWLCDNLGFTKVAVYSDDNIVHHALLQMGSGMVMLSSKGKASFDEYVRVPKEIENINTQSAYIYLENLKGHYDQALNKGVEIVLPYKVEPHGAGYTCRDPEGYLWSFGDYDPGAKLKTDMLAFDRLHINCDMGESYGRYTLVRDEVYMPFIRACNIACGFHAGDPVVIERTLRHAKSHNLEIGAHPSFPDRQGFGRRVMDITESELESLVRYQVGAIKSIAEALDLSLSHVKAHGALYNQAASDYKSATAVAKAVRSISHKLTLYAPYDSVQSKVARDMGLPIKHEAFIDRRYNDDGTLVSRKNENAIITKPEIAWQQVTQILTENKITSINGNTFYIEAETFCIHSDSPNALAILKFIQHSING